MNTHLVTAAMTASLPPQVPAEILFIPEGRRTITPRTHPQGVEVNLPADRGEAIAAEFNRELQKLQSGDVAPWFDFEHTRRAPASGFPLEFRYERGRGLMCAVDWSRAGRGAIEGRDARHFSPEFFIDGDGVPSGLPSRGPLGGLVAEPAFRNIGPIAAGAGGSARGMLELVAAGQIDEAIQLAEENPAEYDRYRNDTLGDETKAPNPIRAGEIEDRARALVAAGEASSFEDGMEQIFSQDPALYLSYLANQPR